MKYNMVCPQCKSSEMIETNNFPQAKDKEGAQYQCRQCRCKIRLRIFSDGFADTRRETKQ